jgi:hypothetical protein
VYDIILVRSWSRSYYYYLNIIKHLSAKYKIALLLIDKESFEKVSATRKSKFVKSKDTEDNFDSLCLEYGADKIYINQKHTCKIMLMPVVGPYYNDEYLSKFKSNISWETMIGIFYLIGPTHVNEIKELGVVKYFASHKELLVQGDKSDGVHKDLEGLDIVYTGLPYRKYPVFDNLKLEIDYLIAYPSSIHFRDGDGKHKEKYEFSKMLLKALSSIDKNDKVFLKLHSSSDKREFYATKWGKNVYLLRVAIFIAEILKRHLPFYKKHLYALGGSLRCSFIEAKYPSLEKLTEYHNFGIELFLPHVNKGVLTGHSTVTFHALYNKLPVYNCDSQEKTIGIPEGMEPYMVPCCNGNLQFDKSNFNKIDEEFKNADIIQVIKEELDGV